MTDELGLKCTPSPNGWSLLGWSCLTSKKEGDAIRMTVFREGRLREFEVPLREMPKDKITVKPRKGDAVATRRRKAWLG